MKLRSYIKTNKLTIKKTAIELGVSYETVRKWCNEQAIPRKHHIEKIQKWSNESVRISDFYSDADNA